MSELIPPPSDWKYQLSLSATNLSSQLGNHRLLSIKSFIYGSTRLYSGVSVEDEGLGGSWNGQITPPDLKTTLNNKFRLTALDCFEEKNVTYCAAAWVENPDAIQWNWGHDMTPDGIKKKLYKEDGKLINIRAYRTTLNGIHASPVLRYCAIWVEDDGVEWDWIPNADADFIADILDDKSARLISIDNLDHETWLGDDERFCAVWYRNVTGQPWFWNIGLNKAELPLEPPKFCSWGHDVSFCAADNFVSLMEQYTKPGDPGLSNLMTMNGSGDASVNDNLSQNIQWHFTEQNLVSEQVTLESAFMFSAAEGGWSWWSGNYTDSDTDDSIGLPIMLNASQSYNSSPSWTVSNNPKIGIFPFKAVASGSKHQYLLSQAVITQAGFPTPQALPINWPVFLGIQAPVEIIRLTNGKLWGTVIGQVVNGTGKKLDITNVSVKLKDQNNITVHKTYLTNDLFIDQDVHGKGLATPLSGPVSGSDAPLPKFYDGFEVPRSFKGGTLKVQANVKFHSGELDCYGDGRTLKVELAPVTVMDRLPYDIPVIGGTSNDAYRWHWGNGINCGNFTVHSYPEHRYSFDLGVWDSSNKTYDDPNLLDQNDNFYCWEQPVLAMTSGEVIFVADAFDDNWGQIPNPNSTPLTTGANMVVIYNSALDCYHGYFHLKQNEVTVNVGDIVNAGDKLGLVGNSGGSEPHLHIGICRRDSDGFLRSLPMTFLKIKNDAGGTVSGVPADNDCYSEASKGLCKGFYKVYEMISSWVLLKITKRS